MKGQTDSTYYTHYSSISTVEANWQLKNLGRNDVNKTMSNVFDLVANVTGYKNLDVPVDQRPMTNLSGVFAGPLNANIYVPFTAPANMSAIGAGGQGVLILPGLNTSFTPSLTPASVNLTAQGLLSPWMLNTSSNSTPSSSAPSKGAAAPLSISYAPAIIAIVAAVGTVFV
jgi:hypothetical protein